MRCGRYTTGLATPAPADPAASGPAPAAPPASRSASAYRYETPRNSTPTPRPEAPNSGSSLPPCSGSGASSSAKIRFVDVMPFIATWKYEPSCRNGMKKSAASRIVSNTAAIGVKPSGSTPDSAKTPDGESEPDTNRHTATPMPAAAPPYATASIAVSERSWICSTFMVITRNCSAFSSMTRAARSSASKVFSVSSPCRLSRNDAPISVYLPQHF